MHSQQVDLFIDRLLDAPIKDDQALMEFPFFSLQKNKRMKPFVYDDGNVQIRVEPGHTGMATIWDKDILIYIASILNSRVEAGENPGPKVRFNVHDFLISTGRSTGRSDYERFHKAIDRLLGTVIKTSIESDQTVNRGGFAWIKGYQTHERVNKNGKKVTVWAQLELNDWMYRALVKDRRVLSINSDYFRLGGLERRLYELARKKTGRQPVWEVSIGKLQQRCGATCTPAKFKWQLKQIQKEDKLPDYSLQVHENIEDPKAFTMNFRKGATVVCMTPKGTKPIPAAVPETANDDATIEGEYRVLDQSESRKVEGKEHDLTVSTDAIEQARAHAPDWDVYFLEREWKKACQRNKARIRKPDSAFLAYVRAYVKDKDSPEAGHDE